MNRQIQILTMLCMMTLFSCGPNKNQSRNVESLFVNGANNWSTLGFASWRFIDGEIVGKVDSGFSYLITKETYKDFELTLQFQPDSSVNSGIFLRCKTKEPSAADCYEINIWDLHPNQDNRTGSIVTRMKPLEYIETINQWSTYKMRCEGNRIQAWIDGVMTADLQDDQLVEGYIAVQAAGVGVIKFRDVQLVML